MLRPPRPHLIAQQTRDIIRRLNRARLRLAPRQSRGQGKRRFESDRLRLPDGVGTALTGAVLAPGTRRHIPADQFAAGVVDHRPGQATAPFDGAAFTNAAMTAGRGAVAIDTGVLARTGLGYSAVVVQASDGLAPHDFTLFEVPVVTQPGFEEEKTMSTGPAQRRDVPPRGDLVF